MGLEIRDQGSGTRDQGPDLGVASCLVRQHLRRDLPPGQTGTLAHKIEESVTIALKILEFEEVEARLQPDLAGFQNPPMNTVIVDDFFAIDREDTPIVRPE